MIHENAKTAQSDDARAANIRRAAARYRQLAELAATAIEARLSEAAPDAALTAAAGRADLAGLAKALSEIAALETALARIAEPDDDAPPSVTRLDLDAARADIAGRLERLRAAASDPKPKAKRVTRKAPDGG